MEVQTRPKYRRAIPTQCTPRQAAIGLILLLRLASAQSAVHFFYSPLEDSCEWGPSNTFQATNNSANGGLCAYIGDTNRLYACPAPDP